MLGAALSTPKRKLVRLLEGLSFELNEGDRLAILGRNGAGKSTLLRVLNQVYLPTKGTLQVNGSCQALLNMSLGFNNEATVRENIFLRGVAMGLKFDFLREHVDLILNFSGLREKANHRLRVLSTGQRMRLGFAISTSVQHDIILMDEWVGAGDADFMHKAKTRMESRVDGAKIIVLASHSTGVLRDICNKGIVLERGRMVFSGDIVSSLSFYHSLMAEERNKRESVGEIQVSEAQAYGFVEDVSLSEQGTLLLRGWFADTEGAVPASLTLDIGGMLYSPSALHKHRRPDVINHLGLLDDDYGFVAEFTRPPELASGAWKTPWQIYAGSPGNCHAPITLVGSAVGEFTKVRERFLEDAH